MQIPINSISQKETHTSELILNNAMMCGATLRRSRNLQILPLKPIPKALLLRNLASVVFKASQERCVAEVGDSKFESSRLAIRKPEEITDGLSIGNDVYDCTQKLWRQVLVLDVHHLHDKAR